MAYPKTKKKYYVFDKYKESYNQAKSHAKGKKIIDKYKDLDPNIKVSVRRIRKLPKTEVTSARKAVDICGKLAKKDRENLWVLYLNTKNKLNGIERVSVGTLNASLIHPREVFKSAILTNSNSIILLHNHPSGDPSPSGEDRNVARMINQSSKIMSINFLDFIILGNNKYYSFQEQNEEPFY